MICTRRTTWRCFSAAALVSLALTPTAGAQCNPMWDRTIGAVGVGDGYAGPMAVWTPPGAGATEGLYIGGSFSTIGGAQRRGIGRWNPATNTWSNLAQGCFTTNTNYFVAAVAPHDADGPGPLASQLIVGGGFATASNVANTANLASWNGTAWSSIANPAPNGAIWSIVSWNNRVYIGGGIGSVGGVSASGVASLSGTTWGALGVGMAGGFAPGVFAMKPHNDGTGEKLYVGGRFASIGGFNGLIARWNGDTWEGVGSGVTGASPLFGIEAMAVFDEDGPGGNQPALYVAGADLQPTSGPPGVPVSVLKWDGAAWLRVGQSMGGRTTALAVFDDGNGPALYAAGTAQPGISYFAKLVNGQWAIAFDGVGGAGIPPSNFPSVFGLASWGDRLVVAGNFTLAGGEGNGGGAARGLAFIQACERCRADFNNDGFLNSQDFFDFVVALVSVDPRADYNDDGFINSQDFFDFITGLFAGCP